MIGKSANSLGASARMRRNFRHLEAINITYVSTTYALILQIAKKQNLSMLFRFFIFFQLVLHKRFRSQKYENRFGAVKSLFPRGLSPLGIIFAENKTKFQWWFKIYIYDDPGGL